MSDSVDPRRARRTTVIIVGVLVLVLAVVTVVGLLTAGSATPAATVTTGTAQPSSTPASTPTAPESSATPSEAFTPTPAVTASAPQPTKTATISSPAPITKSLTAAVTRMEAVQGAASGPGEIAGPSVRFTVTITNATDGKVDLSNTVVNAYSGTDSAPAVELQGPGGKSFPSSVAAGRSATGVFVFNIPKADRAHVEITVDTSVLNPVVAFKGAAPR